MSSNLLKLIYYAIVSSCVAISAYLSYFGYLSLTGKITLLFVAIIALGLLGADIVIQQNRSTSRPQGIALGCFAFFSLFSMASNFNYVYSSFMERDAAVEALEGQLDHFRNDLITTRSRLEESQLVQSISRDDLDLNRELDRLETQVLDPLRPGCGERCRRHIRNIERVLGKPLSGIATPAAGQPPEAYKDWYNRLRTSVEIDWKETRLRGEAGPLVSIIDDIDFQLLKFSATPKEIAETLGLPALEQMAEASASIERRAKTVLPDDSGIEHIDIDASQGRLGELPYTFQNAFVQRPNPLLTFIALILSIVVDIFPLVFAFMAFSDHGGKQRQSRRPKQGRAGTTMD